MSKQLTLSAAFSAIAMTAMALAMIFAEPTSDGARRGSAAHGSLVSVLLRA